MKNYLNVIMDNINEYRYETNKGDNNISSDNDEGNPFFTTLMKTLENTM